MQLIKNLKYDFPPCLAAFLVALPLYLEFASSGTPVVRLDCLELSGQLLFSNLETYEFNICGYK